MKSIFNKFFARVAFGLTVILPLVATLSCEVGLGEAVDVSAPTCTITYPPSGAVVRDSFVLAGECKDDVKVTRVAVRVVNTTTGKKVYETDADIDLVENSFSVTLNENNDSYAKTNGWQFADGTYEITAWAYDNSGKTSGVSSRSVDIDNTAPLFIISKPGVTVASGDEASAYGSTFAVTGTIADLHEISRMSLDVYDKAGNKITDSSSASEVENIYETSIATAGGSSVEFANTTRGTSEQLPLEYERYVKLYGVENLDGCSDTKEFKCTVTLSDSAKLYKTPGDSGTGEGNETSTVYLYDKVYKDLLSSAKGLGLSATSLMNISNGCETNSSLSMKQLKERSTDTRDFKNGEDNRLAFTLNPAANPTYVISGLSVPVASDGSTDVSVSVANGQNLTATISAGLNNTSVSPKDICVWVKDMNSDLSEGINPANSYTEAEAHAKFLDALATAAERVRNDGDLVDSFEENVLAAINGNNDVWCVKNNGDSTASSGTIINVGFEMPKIIKVNHYYIVAVTAVDQDGLEVLQKQIYGFKGAGTGKLPSVVVTEPSTSLPRATSEKDNGSNKGLTFKGKAVFGDLEISRLNVSVKVTDEETGDVKGTITDTITFTGAERKTDTDGSIYYDWSFSPAEAEGYNEATKCVSGKEYLYEATITATDKGGSTCPAVYHNIHVDTKKPEVTITGISPTVTDYVTGGTIKTNVNGKITLKANIEETNLETVMIDVYEGSDASGRKIESLSSVIGKALSLTRELDTTEVVKNVTDADAKPVFIVLTAVDKSGNSNTYTSTQYNRETTGKDEAIWVNQLTDKPVIEANNFYENVAFADIKVNNNLFGLGTNNVLSGTVKDDDGIQKIVISYRKSGDSAWTDNEQNLSSASTSKTFNYALPEAAGEYEIKIYVEDTKGNAGYCTRAFETKVAVSSGAPDLNIGSQSGQFKAPAMNVSVAGTLTTDNEIKTFTCDGNAVALPAAGSNTWTNSFTTESEANSYTKTYIAIDKYEQKTTKTFNYKIDTDKPVVSFASAELENEKAISVSNYVIRGASNDTGNENSQSGINCIWYKVSEGKGVATPSVPADAAAEGWSQVSTTGDWNLIFDFVDYANNSEADMKTKFAEGKYTIHVFSVDNAGNNSAVSSKNFDVKLSLPVVNNLKAFEKTGADNYGTTEVNQTSKAFRFTYTVDDSYAPERPAVSVVVKKDSNVITTGFTSAYTYPDGSVTFDSLAANGTADGTYTVSVTATDSFGKKSATQTAKIIYDTTKPVVAITAPADSSSWTNMQNVTVSGTAKDNDGGVGVETVYIADGETEPAHNAVNTWTAVTVSGTQWSTNKTLTTEGAGVQIWVYTKDKVGNESATKSTTLKYDKTKPVIESVQIKKNNEATPAAFSTVSTYANKNTYEISGSIKGDGYSPLKAVYATCDGNSFTTANESNKNVLDWGKTTGNVSYGSWTITASAMSEGSHEYVVTVEDEAGNISEALRKTIIVDTVAPTVTKISLPDAADTKLTKFKFDGSITDGVSSSGIESVKVTVADKNESSKNKEYDAAGKEEWNSTVYFTGYNAGNVFETEGEKTVTVTVTDKAGNSNSKTETFIYDKEDPAVTVSSTITGIYMPLAGGTINAEVKDSYKLKESELLKVTETYEPSSGSKITTTRVYYNDNGTLKVKTNGGTGATVTATEFNSASVNGNHYKASISIPFHKDGGKPVSGKYEYVLGTNDAAGNNVDSSTMKFTADLNPPSIAITSPKNNTGTSAVKVENYTFKGTTGDDVSGVKTIYYQIVASGAAAPSLPADLNNPGSSWKIATLQQTSWEFTQEFAELYTQAAAAAADPSATALKEGRNYKIYAFAVDNANNASGLTSEKFDVDFNKPTVELAGAAKTSGKNFDNNVTNDDKFEISYEVKDTHGLNETKIVVTKGNTTLVADSGYTVTSNNEAGKVTGTITLKNSPADGDYTFTITATDVVGKTNESGTGVLTVKLDRTAPSIEITTPSFETTDGRLVSDWITGTNNVKVAGTTEDNGSGVLNVWIKNGTDVSIPAGDKNLDATWTAAGWTSRGKTSWTIPSDAYSDGETTINIVAVDKIGNVSATKSAVLLVDKDKPTIGKYSVDGSDKEAVKAATGEGPSATTSYVLNKGTLLTNKNVTLEGYVEDAYKLASVTIVLTDGTTTKKYSNVSGTGITVITPVKNNGDKKWTWTLPKFMTGSSNSSETNYLADGTYTVTVTAVDAGGSEAAYTSTLKVDTTAPVLKFSSPEFDSTNVSASATSWVTGTRNVKIIGTTEDDFVVSSVQYKLSTESDWTTLTGKNNWTINAPSGGYANGNPVVEIRATDEAGNTSSVYSRTLKIDEKAPVIKSYEKSENSTVSKYGVVVTEKDTTDVLSYINDKTTLNVRRNFTLSGKITDDWKVTAIDVEITGGNITYSTKFTDAEVSNVKKKLVLTNTGINTGAVTWSTPEFNVKTTVDGKININDGTYTVTVTARDEGGQEDVQTNTIVVDTTAPEFSTDTNYVFRLGSGIYNSETWYSGTELIVEGYYIEALTGIKTLKCVLTPSGETEAKPEVEFAVTKSEANNKVYYKFKGSVANFKKGESNSLKFTAEDEAGNKSADRVFVIKMDDVSPEPIARYVSIDGGKTFVNAGTITVNKKQNLAVYGSVSDTDSGLSGNAVFKMGNTEVSPIAGSLKFSTTDISAAGYSKDTFAEKLADSSFQAFETYAAAKAKTYKSWTAIIPAASLAEGALKVTFNDIAGNNGSAQVASFQVDESAPVVKVSTANVNINGTKNITGTVSENLTLSSMELYYSTSITGTYAGGTLEDDPKSPADFGWTKFGSTITDVSDIYSWTYENFDFNTYSGAKNKTSGDDAGMATVYILPVVKDAAGNCNVYTSTLKTRSVGGATEYYTEYVWDLDNVYNGSTNATGTCYRFDVDMNADRPVVQVTNLARSGAGTAADPYKYILKYGTNAQISGSISDDDAETDNTVKVFLGSSRQIKSVAVSGTTYTATFKTGTPATAVFAYSKAADGTITWTNSDEGTTTLKGSDWSYTPKDVNDGQKSVYFYVMDNNNGEFYSGNDTSETLFQPYFQYKSDTKTNSAAALTYGSDCNSPKVNYVKVGSYNKDDAKNKDPDDSTKDLIEDIGTSLYAGGEKKKSIELIINADDANGISGIMVYGTQTVGGVTKSFKYKKGGIPDTEDTTGYTENGSLTANGNASTWTSGKINLGEWKTGEVAVTVNVFDNSGLKGNGSYSFNIDNSAPVIDNIEPASNEQKTGKVELKGTASDSDTGRSGLAELTYLVPTKTQVTEATTDAERAALTGWAVNKTEAMGSWVFKFNGENGAKDNPLLSSYIDDAETYVTPDAFNICDIPVWIKAVDNLGNVAIARHTIKYNKDGDKPSTKFTYPTEESYAKDGSGNSLGYVTLGSTIRVTGTVNILNEESQAKPDGVYIQIANATYKAKKGLTIYTALKDLKLNSSQADEVSHAKDSCIKADQLTGLTEGTDYSKKTIAAGGSMTALETAWLEKGVDYEESFVFDNNAMLSSSDYGYTVVTADTIATKTTDASSGSHKVNIAPFTVTGADSVERDGGSGFKTAAERSAWWGIPVTNTTSSWNIAINASGELNPKQNTNITNNIAIRACAVNNEGKVGAWSDTYYVHIDDAAPKMTAEMRQYNVESPSADNLAEANYTAATAYEPGMYLKGAWYLYLEISDESGIKAESDNGVQFNMPTSTKYIKETVTTGNRSYKVWIPVSGNDGALLTYKISATDTDIGNNHTITGTYQFYLDNTAPTFDKVTTIVSGDENIIPASGMSAYKIKDSDGQFSISSEVEEGGSGFERTAFYLIRKSTGAAYAVADGTKTSILDCFSIGGTPKKPTDVKVPVEGLTEFEVKQGDNTYKLYGKVYSGNQNSGKDRFSANVTANTHIRVGGLVAVDGMLRRIEEITSEGVRFSPAATGSATSANFIYAQIVDNKTAENGSVKNSENAYGFVFKEKDGKTTDDGDGMPEKVDVTASGVTWNAYIRSSNLPDGPATLVILAFDKAGNVSCREIDTSVANNAPRIAKVFLGTDIDGNSKYDANEFVEYNWSINEFGQIQTDKYTDSMTLKTKDYVSGKKSVNSEGVGNGKSFIIKNGLAVVPEIVGGNIQSGGSIGMVYNRAATSAGATTGTASAPAATTAYALPSSAELTDSANSFYGYTLTNLDISGKTQAEFSAITKDKAGTINGTGKGMSFTFWDETEEGVKGSSTQSAVLYVEDFDIDLIDVKSPTAVIHPFHWNSKTDNSIKKDSDGNLLGHIELEDDLSDDLKTAAWGDGTAGKPIDPKISGKVVISGYAYDETRLGKITISETTNKFTLTNCYSEYKNTSGTVAWTSASGTGWTLTVSNRKAPSQEGHLAEWTLEIDSEKVTGVACKDIKFTVTAEDATILSTKNASTPGTTQTGRSKQADGKLYYATAGQYEAGKLYDSVAAAVAGTTVSTAATTFDKIYVQGVADATNTSVYAYYCGTTGYYQMDVVPYVTKVTTSLSGLDESFPTAHSRSALGRYTVRSDENIVIEGFNIGTNAATVSDGTTTVALASKKVDSDDTANTNNVLSIGALKTGEVTLSINSIPAMNNINSNDSRGDYQKTVAATKKEGDEEIYSNYYNRQPNGYNNNRLTDNIELAVWEIDDDAVQVATGMALQPIMKINPADDRVGFAFMDGALHFALPRGDAKKDKPVNSYERWIMSFDFFTSVGFTYDEKGHSWGVSAGGDINSSVGDTYHLSGSQWDNSSITDRNAGHNGSNLVHMDQIGIVNNGSNVHVKQRFKSSSLATTVHGKTGDIDNTNIYLAYFDSVANEIRFKAGTNTSTSRDTFATANSKYFANHATNSLSALKTSETQAIAKSGVDERGTGLYVSIAAVPGTSADNDVVVCVWYDNKARKMRYSYNTSPLTVEGRAGNTPTSTTKTPAGWSDASTIFTGKQRNAGEYCQIAVDKNGGIHIAAYDSQNMDLVYAYAPSYDGTFTSCVVDSSGVVGDKLTLDVAFDKKDGNAIPHIGYYASSSVRPKYAYRVDTTSTAPAGTTSDKVTGTWETVVVPTNSNINHEANGQHNKINIGVWKDSDGAIKNSTTGTTSWTSDKYKGDVWGNGTKNAILGYAIDLDGVNGNIETAQMR